MRCFVAVAEELHFGRAATRLNMTQPPLSRQIQVLERILKVSLLNRNSRSVTLTSAGQAFLVEARRIVQLTDSAAAIARSAAEGRTGIIRLGFTAASGYGYVPRLLSHANTVLPNAHLLLREMVSGEQIEALITNRIDVALLRPPLRRVEFGSQLVLKERFVVCSPAKISTPDRPKRLTDFNDLPFIMYAPDAARYFHDLVAGLFATAGAAPKHVQYVTQIHSIMMLVGAGLGYALVPEVASRLRPEGVVFSALEGVEPLVELHVAWMKAVNNPTIERFLRALEELPDIDPL
nr:LysR family transcriptional regulator [Sphingobium nicotianae]